MNVIENPARRIITTLIKDKSFCMIAIFYRANHAYYTIEIQKLKYSSHDYVSSKTTALSADMNPKISLTYRSIRDTSTIK